MVQQVAWLERAFDFSMPIGMVPSVLERLRGTPARLEERLRGAAPAVATARRGSAWTIQEIVGHLVQVEELWWVRLDDFEQGRDTLRAAAHDRTRVNSRAFNGQPLVEILGDFRAARGRLVARLEGLPDEIHERRALHPRLQCRIRVLDHMVFAAEHDDHHLARLSVLLA